VQIGCVLFCQSQADDRFRSAANSDAPGNTADLTANDLDRGGIAFADRGELRLLEICIEAKRNQRLPAR